MQLFLHNPNVKISRLAAMVPALVAIPEQLGVFGQHQSQEHRTMGRPVSELDDKGHKNYFDLHPRFPENSLGALCVIITGQ